METLSYPVEVSVVIPCLDEADTIAECVEQARRALVGGALRGEVIVVDNGSADQSKSIASGLGARLVEVANRGYGNAVVAGIAAARGTYVVVGDADASYDFREIPRFVEKLREGNDFVQGCRLPAGGGSISSGAMPVLHRRLGNPMFSWLARQLFGTTINDIHCGLKAFKRTLIPELDLRCPGFEFNCEVLLEATRCRAKIAELPITLHRHRRLAHPPHLHTFRDGWRHLWFFLLYRIRRAGRRAKVG